MTALLTFATAIMAGWVIDRLAFRGELSGMVKDEIAVAWARRKPPPKTQRGTGRRGANGR